MRSKQEIEQDIGQQCVVAGDLQYRIEAYKQSLTQTNNKLGELHQEMHDLQQAENAALHESGADTKAEVINGEV